LGFLLLLVFWNLIWILDYYFGVHIEWIPFGILAIWMAFKWSFVSTAVLTFITLIIHYIFPFWIICGFSSFVLHISTIALIRFAITLDQKANVMEYIKGTPLSYLIAFFGMEYVDFFYRDRPQTLSFLGSYAIVWTIFLWLFVVAGEFIRQADQKQQKQTQSQQETNSSKTLETEIKQKTKKTKKCASCGKTELKLKLCAGCNLVYYCSTGCQKEDRPLHKPICKPNI
jgi:hypothetical protein